jgi:hypothetical protein
MVGNRVDARGNTNWVVDNNVILKGRETQKPVWRENHTGKRKPLAPCKGLYRRALSIGTKQPKGFNLIPSNQVIAIAMS